MNINVLEWKRELLKLQVRLDGLYEELDNHAEFKKATGYNPIIDDKEDLIYQKIKVLVAKAKVLHDKIQKDNEWVKHVNKG